TISAYRSSSTLTLARVCLDADARLVDAARRAQGSESIREGALDDLRREDRRELVEHGDVGALHRRQERVLAAGRTTVIVGPAAVIPIPPRAVRGPVGDHVAAAERAHR